MKSPQRITIAQRQRLSLNASLSASIQVLRADAAGLSRFLEEQAADLPALRLTAPAPGRDWLPRWSSAFAADATPEIEAAGPSLAAHVTAAIAALDLDRPDRRIAMALTDALEPSGWLGRTVPDLATALAVAPDRVQGVLARLQGIDPPGLFARGLEECLRLQATDAGELDSAMAAVLAHLTLVAAGDLAGLARRTGVPPEDLAERIRRLRRYDPKPGARFAPGASPVPEPDLTATRTAQGWQVGLNRSALPALSLAEGAGQSQARTLIRLVERRNATLLRIAQEVLRRQQTALEEGFGALLPMTIAEVAAALDLHATTVSRAVAGTAVDTPRGTWWLRALFSVAVRPDGPAGASLRDALSRMIAGEDRTRPLTDQALAEALAGAGAPLARRTVAKYRDQLGIPAAHARRKRARRG